jgi:hypothetical protein
VKNWWSIKPVFLVLLLPWVLAALPTVNVGQLKASEFWIGGGFIREWLAQLFIDLLPLRQADTYAVFFTTGDVVDEYLAAVPGLLLMTVGVLWGLYLIGSLYIYANNWIVRTNQKSIRSSLKR